MHLYCLEGGRMSAIHPTTRADLLETARRLGQTTEATARQVCRILSDTCYETFGDGAEGRLGTMAHTIRQDSTGFAILLAEQLMAEAQFYGASWDIEEEAA